MIAIATPRQVAPTAHFFVRLRVKPLTDLRGLQTQQFRRISERFAGMRDPVGPAICQILQDHLGGRIAGKRILDVGNGGQDPSSIVGEDIASKLSLFVGLDRSFEMLTRAPMSFPRVRGDGLCLPFADRSFDHVLINGVLHHLGYDTESGFNARVERFIQELKRVSAGEILVYEIFTPWPLEACEKAYAAARGPMPTFVLSERTLDRALGRIGLRRREVLTVTLSQLTGPFFWYLVMLDHPWLKLPACVSPFRHSFFTI